MLVDVTRQIGGYGLSGTVEVSDSEQFGFLVSGQMQSAGRFTGEDRAFPVFFAMQFSPKPTAHGTETTGAGEADTAHPHKSKNQESRRARAAAGTTRR